MSKSQDMRIEALKERIAALEQERDGVHAMLIDMTKERDTANEDNERLRVQIQRAESLWDAERDRWDAECDLLRSEVERLSAPVSDEEASGAVGVAMTMELGGTYQEAMEAMIAARRRP